MQRVSDANRHWLTTTCLLKTHFSTTGTTTEASAPNHNQNQNQNHMLTPAEHQYVATQQVVPVPSPSRAFLQYLSALDTLKCRYCQSIDVTYRLLQTRSADEGLTTFFVCQTRHKQWQS